MNVLRRLRARLLRRPRLFSRKDSHHNNSYANISKPTEDQAVPKEDWACLYLPSPAITRHPAFERIQERILRDAAPSTFHTRPIERKEREPSSLAIVKNIFDATDTCPVERKNSKPSLPAFVRNISIMAEARQRAPSPMKRMVEVEIPRAVLYLAKACAAFRRAGKENAARRFQIYITALGTGPCWQDPAVNVALQVAPNELPPRADNVWKRAEYDIKFARACLRKVIEIVRIEERGCLMLLEADWARFEAGGFDKKDVWDT